MAATAGTWMAEIVMPVFGFVFIAMIAGGKWRGLSRHPKMAVTILVLLFSRAASIRALDLIDRLFNCPAATAIAAAP